MRRRIGICPGLLLALFVAAVTTPAPAQQSTRLLWQYPGVENVVAATWIEDLNADGAPDVLFESYDAGAPATNHLFAISGRSAGIGTVIWAARPLGGPSNSGGYGEYCLQVSADLTGDGTNDVLYGAAWGNRSAFLLDGTNGSTVWSFDTYADSPPNPPASGWVYDVSSLGSDLTGDGYPEVLFCAGSDNHCVYCANGITGEILWHFRGQDAIMFVESIGDVDGDGTRDVVAAQSDSYPRVFVFSGAGGVGGTAVTVWSQPLVGGVWSCCEILLPEPDAPTIVVGTWDNQIHGYNAATGTIRWNGNVGSYVMKVVVIQDVDGDGIDDIGVGSWGSSGRVHSGADGSPIWVTAVGDDCWTCDAVDDTNGDGHQDLAVGSFNGRVYLMDGVTGAILWSFYVADKLFTVCGVPDLTGNGIPDVVAGTQKLGGSGGICYAFEGNDDISASVDGGIASLDRPLRVGPNPFRTDTRWSFRLEASVSSASLRLFDPAGRLVRILHQGPAGAGASVAIWDGRSDDGEPLPAGIYLGRLDADGRILGSARVVRLP